MNLSFILIDGKYYRWRDILALRREQLSASMRVRASQLALFEDLHDDCRPSTERTAATRYQQPSLF